MTCQQYERQIGEHVDRALPSSAIPELEAHLAVCTQCRALRSDLEAIRLLARSMAPHVPPPHVWTAIAAATSSRSHRSRWSAYFSFGWQPALATAMTLLLSTGLWWVGARLATVTVPPSALAEPGSDDARAGLAQEEAHYTTAIATLEDVTNAERTALDPDTAVVLQTSMTVIDDAIAESRAALDTDPESEIAQESLFEALHRKVVVLQRTLALINEMRKGNPDGAARIISELNQ